MRRLLASEKEWRCRESFFFFTVYGVQLGGLGWAGMSGACRLADSRRQSQKPAALQRLQLLRAGCSRSVAAVAANTSLVGSDSSASARHEDGCHVFVRAAWAPRA